MNGKGNGDNPLKAAALLGALGLDVGICIFIGYWLGSMAGERFGDAKAWTVGGLLLGLAVGIITAIMIVKKVLEDSDG
jgi:Putative F0F1-ATPase subunit (ATPase_gene1).